MATSERLTDLRADEIVRRGGLIALVAEHATAEGPTSSEWPGLTFSGYASISHFINEFKRTYGETLGEYAERLREITTLTVREATR